MNLIIWLFYQLLSYGFWWLAFLAIAYLAAKSGRWWVIPIGHLATAAIILYLDVAWIRKEMSQPGWSPENGPDMDIIFAIGMLARILLINSVLLPFSVIVLKKNKKKPIQPPEPMSGLAPGHGSS